MSEERQDPRRTPVEDGVEHAPSAEYVEEQDHPAGYPLVKRVPRNRIEEHVGLWRLVMGDRPEHALHGRAVKEAVAVAYEDDEGQVFGVFMTPVATAEAEDPFELEELLREYAAMEWGLAAEDIQTTVQLLRTDAEEADLIRAMHDD
ncbi:hypothetical protein H3H54_12680 [Brachybacterium sp. Z12]|uniref:hypothetical protein n=1 Tax=Brachybacterium sp. Z12 TaxID=2759167 RepID=UPI00185F5369|nr:hypothetical protein [Brachybacterium sp. Z12]QNN82062.1 hypothetical protein H3H54_12680 [Brachybacterium sp. Z12]